jgi:hypothetical protein
LAALGDAQNEVYAKAYNCLPHRMWWQSTAPHISRRLFSFAFMALVPTVTGGLQGIMLNIENVRNTANPLFPILAKVAGIY